MSEEDRELLRLAAQAAGIKIEFIKSSNSFETVLAEHEDPSSHLTDGYLWNPLEDDGDALRLAAKLDIGLRLNGDELTAIAHWFRGGKTNRVVGNYETGNAAAIRRLIVRAAATIAKPTW